MIVIVLALTVCVNCFRAQPVCTSTMIFCVPHLYQSMPIADFDSEQAWTIELTINGEELKSALLQHGSPMFVLSA